MSSYTLADLERIVAIEKGGGHVTSHDHFGHVTSYNPPPIERDIRRDIYDAVFARTQINEWADRGYIAAALNLKKTRWLYDHIDRLVNESYLVRVETVQSNGMKHFWYAIARGS